MRCRIIAVLITVVLLSACKNQLNISLPRTRDWRGATTRNLFKEWGYPDRIVRLAKNHHILIYKKKIPSCQVLFKVNQHNQVIANDYRGAGCEDYSKKTVLAPLWKIAS